MVKLDIPMPDGCQSCPLRITISMNNTQICTATRRKIETDLNTGYDSNCPIVKDNLDNKH